MKERLFQLVLNLKSSPGRLQRYIERSNWQPAEVPVVGGGGKIGAPSPRVAAVQMELRLHKSAKSFADQVAGLTARAVQRGAELIAFPEDSATGLLGFLPGIEAVANAPSMEAALTEAVGDGVGVADLFRFIAPATQRIYEATFSALARRFGVYLVTGSAILPGPTGELMNIAYFYGPDGSLLGKQYKCHFIPMEVDWGLAPGDDLNVHELPWGKVALPICMDATYFETFRILQLLGTDLVVIPTANPEPYNWHLALRGIWPRVQEAQVFGLHSCLVGNLFGLELTGRSGVFAPMALTGDGSGILAQTDSPHTEAVVVADLDLAGLRSLRRAEAPQFNTALLERYLPEIYKRRPRS